MVVPPQLAGFSALERVALERARALSRGMAFHGVAELTAKVELCDPPGGGQRFVVEISITRRAVSLRFLQTRVELAREDLERDDLFDPVDGGAFLPRGAHDQSEDPSTAAAGPISGAGREDTHTITRGEGRAT